MSVLQNHFAEDEFERDYSEALTRLNQAIRDSKIIAKAVEEKLNEEELKNLMAVIRGLMPSAIHNLSAVYHFVNKYENKDNVAEAAKNDFCEARKESDRK